MIIRRKKIYNLKFIKNFLIIIFISLVSYILYNKYFNLYNTSFNINEVPYISTYYIKPIVTPDEDVIIDFYITDYYQKEYSSENSDERFTVTIKIDGKKDIIKRNLKAGDHSINIGKFDALGEQKFSILCTDKYKRNSHELFNYFLVRKDIQVNEYIMSEADLINYNINNKNDKNNGQTTREGLQNLLDDKKSEGYNKLKMLPGIYRIDHIAPLYIPTEFTLDLNESTIKLNGFTGDSSIMIELNNTFDSHVVNGIIEGDFYEHDYKNSPNSSEWVIGVNIGGESKYSSFENLVIKDITGYGASNGIAKSRDENLYYTYYTPTKIGDTFKLGDIDRNTGVPIDSNTRTTSEFIDIKNYSDIGYLSVSRYLGYQDNPCSTWNLICHFYDNKKNFIDSVDAYQYRSIGIPNNSAYMKVTILSTDTPDDLSIQFFRVPTHCSFKNIKFENCRAVGFAPKAMKNMLIENCEFTKSGQVLAKSGLDAEDGWDMMQDVTFRNLNFYNNPYTDFLACGGQNFIIEDMIDGKISFLPRSNSYVVRSCYNLKDIELGNSGRSTTGYVRFFNNKVLGDVIIKSKKNVNWPIVIKDSKINGKTESEIGMGKFLRCDIGPTTKQFDDFSNSLGKSTYVNCYIHDKNGKYNYGGNFYNCKIENISGAIQKNLYLDNCNINNFDVYAIGDDANYIFKNSTLNNFSIRFDTWFKGATTLFENCDINTGSNYLLKLPHYSLSKSISLLSNNITSSSKDGLIVFYDDRVNAFTGYLTDQDSLTLEDNTFNIAKSKYLITGLDSNTQNNINIFDINNTYNSNITLVSKAAKKSTNIFINDNK